uniref:Putative secreted protein n=1 Tax=Ixodes ricinus TaxID=34613 RepID=A0A6B0UBG6_IXORI
MFAVRFLQLLDIFIPILYLCSSQTLDQGWPSCGSRAACDSLRIKVRLTAPCPPPWHSPKKRNGTRFKSKDRSRFGSLVLLQPYILLDCF